MKTTTTQFLKACSLSVALLGSAAVVMTVSLPDAAYADNGKGNGGGNGNGGGKSNAGGNVGGNASSSAKSGGNGKSGGGYSSSGKSAEKSKAAKKKVAKSEVPAPTEVGQPKTGKIKPKHIEGDGIAHPSELGALNAAHANPRALENAAPNSRVGRIAAYRDAVIEGQDLAEDLAEKTALWETLEEPRPLVEIDGDLADADADVDAKAEAVRLLEEQLAEVLVSDPDSAPEIEAQLATARTAQTDAEKVAQDLEAERTAAVEYQTLTDEITELTQMVEDQPMVEREALEAAANKPVTDDVEAEVKRLLGL